MRRLLTLTLLVPVICGLFLSCTSQEQKRQARLPQAIRPTPPAPVPPPKLYQYARPNLDFLGMEQVWERPLIDKDAPTVRDAYLLGNYYLIETNTRRLCGFNRISGRPEFVASLEDPTDVRCGEDEDYVYAVARNVLYAIDKRSFIAWRKYLDYSPSSQLIADENNIYMGCYDGTVRAFFKSGRYFEWQYGTYAAVSARPAAGSRFIYAASEDNTVYALSPVDGKRQWQFKTLDPIRANPAYAAAEHRVLVASTDGSLYALYDSPQGNTRESQMAWLAPYPTGAGILKTPIVASGIVYVINENHECHAVDLANGRSKWVLKNISSFIARGDHNVYLLRGTNTILAVDPTSGNARWALDTASLAVSRTLTNTTDGNIYLMRSDGSTILLREHQLQTPKAPEAAPKSPEAAPDVPEAAPEKSE